MTATSLYKTPAGAQIVMALYDAALQHWPVPYETRTVLTRHGDTFVVASGDPDAPPLLLLHGAGSNSSVWAGDVSVYCREYRVYAVDLLGEVGKSAPNRPDWDSPAYAEWLEDVLLALHIERAVLVGISQGAWTALKFAVAHPERVDRLVLMTPGGIIPDKTSFLLKAMLFSWMGKRGQKRMMRLLFAQQPIPDGVEGILTTISAHFKPRLGILPLFTDEELRRLAMPVLLLGGAEDALRDINKIAARLQSLLPDLSVKLTSGAGHALLYTSDDVMAFLTRTAHVPNGV